MQYLLLNVKLFSHYPHYYIESLMCNTSWYWFPEKHKNIFDKGVIVNELGIEEKTLIKSSILDKLDSLTEKRHIPVIGMFFSAGFTLWILLILIFYIIYSKKYRLLFTLLPFIFNYLIILAGPSNAEFRYIIPMYMSLTIMYGCVINEIKKGENIWKKEKEILWK